MQQQRYFSRRGVDEVGGGGSSRESTVRSININLGQLTHKAEYSTRPQELWASCSEGRASVAAPLRINYIYLWRPGVSCCCRFFFFNMFFAALMLALQPVFLLPLSAATVWISVTVYCLLFLGKSWWLLKDSSCFRESEPLFSILLLDLWTPVAMKDFTDVLSWWCFLQHDATSSPRN